MMLRRQGLYAPMTYWSASADLRSRVCNGAGPAAESWFGKFVAWLIPETMWGLRITEAANVHDWMYWEGRTPEEKVDADRTFLLNLIALIEDGTTKVWMVGLILRELRRLRALLYYFFVRECGDAAFVAGKGMGTWMRKKRIA